jgi:hypothetical protein
VSTADSVWAFELGHRTDEIAERLGVPAIRFAPGPLPAGEPERAAPQPLRPTADQEAEAAALVAPIDDDEVRRSVQKAALFGLLRGRVDRPL